MIDPMEPHRGSWWALFGVFLIGFLSWTAATPLMAAPDEGAHAVRAAAVARGQLDGPHRELIIQNWVLRVPEAFAHTADALCFVEFPFSDSSAKPLRRTPNCVPSFQGSDRLKNALTYEFRGTPHLYGLLGIPSLVWPDRVSMYMMRAMNALACAALLASACMSALHRPNRRGAIVGVLAAASPMVWYLAGIINPNGIEIAAAISLWATLLALAAHDSSEPDRRLVNRAGVAIFVLVSIRALGPAWAIAAIVICTLLAEPGRMRALAKLRSARTWGGLALISTAVTAAWVIHAPLGSQMRHPAVGLRSAVETLPDIFRQTVGVFGTDYVTLPPALNIGWALIVGLGVVAAFAFATMRQRLALVAVLVASVMLPLSADGFNVPYIGFPWQGRYGLPLTAGVAVIAFGLIPTASRAIRRSCAAGAVLLLLGQVGAFIAIGRRLGMGVPSGLNLLDYVTRPLWQPDIPAGVLLALMTLVIVAIGTIVLPPLTRRQSVTADALGSGPSTPAPVARSGTS